MIYTLTYCYVLYKILDSPSIWKNLENTVTIEKIRIKAPGTNTNERQTIPQDNSLFLPLNDTGMLKIDLGRSTNVGPRTYWVNKRVIFRWRTVLT